MSDVKNRQPFTEVENRVAEIGKLLGHPARIRVLRTLLENGKMSSTEISSKVPLARTTVIQHITALKDGGCLDFTTDGSTVKYSINPDFFKNSEPILSLIQRCGEFIVEKEDIFKILFICTGNSCRSQMAEGFINHLSNGNVKAYSAGTQPANKVKPEAVKAMAEIGIDISGQQPKEAKQFIGDKTIDLVVVVCQKAEEECPYLFPYSKHKTFMPFTDPETPDEFRAVRDDIKEKLENLLEEL